MTNMSAKPEGVVHFYHGRGTAEPWRPWRALADSLMQNPLDLWDDNDNGRITCAEARRHGIAPVPRSHPAYVYMRDGDGWVCE